MANCSSSCTASPSQPSSIIPGKISLFRKCLCVRFIGVEKIGNVLKKNFGLSRIKK